MTTDEALLALWLQQHDDESDDDYAAALQIPLQDVGVPTPDLGEEDPK